MSFKLLKIADNSIIEIITMNIDSENNILISENNQLDILKLQDFKDMILGTAKDNLNDVAKAPTHRLHTE